MEQAQRFHGVVGPTEMRRRGAVEWDLNDWKWDGDLFIATPQGHSLPPNFRGGQQFIQIPGNSSNTSSSCSDDVHSGVDNGRRDMERKRRVIVVEEDSSEEAASLALNLGGIGVALAGDCGKKAKLSGLPTGRAACQVEDCGADLTKAKDYHRRHKVCELHSKATKALVNNVMQRFCQQCSRFHALQEFDEGKRSCRRRLAGHNKRRRKTQPDAPVQGNSINDEQTNSVLLISLLRILSNIHSNDRSDQTANQDLVAQLLRSLANPSGLHAGKGLPGLLNESQKLLTGGNNGNGHSAKMSAFLSSDHQNISRVIDQRVPLPDSEIPRKGVIAVDRRGVEMQDASPPNSRSMFPIKDSPPAAYSETTAGRTKMNNFDLNDIYIDSDDGTEDLERSPGNGNYATGSVDFPSWARQDSHQSSPPQTSGNSDSASAQSPSSSCGEAQSRTDRIVFKLFGKEPSDFPIVLRGQILDWLAHSPTDIESYIRPGCIILTIYLRLDESLWEELRSDLSSCLTRLFHISDDPFWRTGWVYVRVQNQIAFVHNGQVVLDTSLYLQNSNYSRILSVIPVAVSVDEQVRFQVRGSNLSNSGTRLLCALEGNYLDQEASQEFGEDDVDEEDESEHADLSCSIPNVIGRGFIEVEDHGLSSSFFPFIVAEKDICSEIRTLESVLELKEANDDTHEVNGNLDARRQAMDFINEMGWLFHRSHLKSRVAHLDPNTIMFSFKRFKWLMDFSMDHDWCAVVKKLLDILVAGTVGLGEHRSVKVALSDMGLLHRAVRRNCRFMVELLLRYVPTSSLEEFRSTTGGGKESFLFRPDAQGPAGLTPLHVAAGRDGSEDILDALTDDPGKIGIEAWKNAFDSTGATPEDYARLRGHYAYIHLVQRKINRTPGSGHVVVDIPGESSGDYVSLKQGGAASFEIGTSRALALNKSCQLCDRKTTYYGNTRASLVYRPAMLSMVAIAAVCVCVALLFKSMPNVVCLFQPFRWELLNYGSS